MSRFFVAILMAALLVWSSEAKAFVSGYCPPIFCGVQTPPGGSTDAADTDADTTDKTDEEEEKSQCLEGGTDLNETSISGHAVIGEVGSWVAVKFCANDFVPGKVSEFPGWIPKRVFDQNPSDIGTTVEIHFRNNGMNGQFRTENRRLLSYVKRQPGLFIGVSLPPSFGRTQINYRLEIDAQAMLVKYIIKTFSLGGDVKISGHGVEMIPISMMVNEEQPTIIKSMTALRSAYDRGRTYYYLIFKLIKKLISDDVLLEIDIEHNPYDLDQGFDDFLANIIGLELDVETFETVDRVVSDGSVPQWMLTEIEDRMLQDRAYGKTYLRFVPPRATVFIGNDDGWLADWYLKVGESDQAVRPGKVRSFSRCEPLAEARFHSIFIPLCPGTQGWSLSANKLNNIMAHEWYHVSAQNYFLNFHCCTDRNRMQPNGPRWASEGMAEVWTRVSLTGVDFDLKQEMAWRRERIRNRLPAGFRLTDLNTREGWRKASNEYKHEAKDLAVLMLLETTGWPSFLALYGMLGDYYFAEADKAGLDSTRGFGGNPELAKFSREFFDDPERLEELDKIFEIVFGRTMAEFEKEFLEFLR